MHGTRGTGEQGEDAVRGQPDNPTPDLDARRLYGVEDLEQCLLMLHALERNAVYDGEDDHSRDIVLAQRREGVRRNQQLHEWESVLQCNCCQGYGWRRRWNGMRQDPDGAQGQ